MIDDHAPGVADRALTPSDAVTPEVVPPQDPRARLAGPAMRAFFRITAAWGLTDPQRVCLLGDSVPPSTFDTWKLQGPTMLSTEQMTRCSFIVAIYEGLARLFHRDRALGLTWLQLPRDDPPFFGESPLGYMLRGNVDALAAVRAVVDQANGGPPSREDDPTISRGTLRVIDEAMANVKHGRVGAPLDIAALERSAEAATPDDASPASEQDAHAPAIKSPRAADGA